MLLDIGLGILLSIGTAKLFAVPLSSSFIFIGIIFSLLVDIDAIFLLLKTQSLRKSYRHRTILHYPLIFIPLGTLFFYFFNVPLAFLFFCCSLAHFLHDSIGIGWGIQWLYPFSKNHYTFFYYFQPKDRPKPPFQFVYVWKDTELELLEQTKGDPQWIRHVYLEFHPYGIIEFAVFIFALVTLFLVF